MTKQAEPMAAETGRREYEPPEVRTEEVFETLALTCTKVQERTCSTVVGFQGNRS
jgi:hypothetical protein